MKIKQRLILLLALATNLFIWAATLIGIGYLILNIINLLGFNISITFLRVSAIGLTISFIATIVVLLSDRDDHKWRTH